MKSGWEVSSMFRRGCNLWIINVSFILSFRQLLSRARIFGLLKSI